MLYFSRATSSSNRKDAIAPIRPNNAQWTLFITHAKLVNVFLAAFSSYFHKINKMYPITNITRDSQLQKNIDIYKKYLCYYIIISINIH